MTSIQDLFDFLCELAPLELQMDFDNAGFQLGYARKPVSRVLLALDVTDPVVDEAIAMGAELIVSHHPILFRPPRQITDADPVSARLLRLIENGVAVISMHTNLDIAEGGVNDVLIRLLGAEPERGLDAVGCGRVGTLAEPVPMPAFLVRCRERLQAAGLRYYDSGRPVHRLAVMGGAGGESLEDAFRLGCDSYVSADLKYHSFLRAAELGLNLIDADHFCTEAPVMPVLCEKLRAAFPDLRFAVSERHRQIIRFA